MHPGPIGIDLDHTIADYRRPLAGLCAAHGLDPGASDPKILLRDTLRAEGREREWTLLQGELYGPLMAQAAPAPGFLRFLGQAAERGIACTVISHRTRRPILGTDHDLHAAARRWLGDHGLDHLTAHFEETRESKLARISAIAPAVFIDDLPEVLLDPAFPAGTRALRYTVGGARDTAGPIATGGGLVGGDWDELSALVFGS